MEADATPACLQDEDLGLTEVVDVDGDLMKVLRRYDNECGYASQMRWEAWRLLDRGGR
jgi:hypothetical protein